MTLADEIARAAVETADCQRAPGFVYQPSETVEAWRFARPYRGRTWDMLVGYARGLLDARTPSPNSPATGGRMAQEQPQAGEGLSIPGLTMPPLW